MYRTAGENLGWKEGGPPTALVKESRIVSSPAEIAELQIHFFKEKIRKLNDDLPATQTDPPETLEAAIRKWGNRADNRTEFRLRKIIELETVELIAKLGNTTSFGHDRLITLTLKLVAGHISRHIINCSIKQNKFCNRWKIGKLIPLLKSKKLSRVEPSSYCPISLLPVVSKIAERVIQKQMTEYMEHGAVELTTLCL